MEDNRLFRFPRPAWLNSANTRTFGVYAAGALVRIYPHIYTLHTLTNLPSLPSVSTP